MKTLTTLCAVLCLVGCDNSHNYQVVNIYDSGNCQEAISHVTSRYGPPEDVDDTGFTNNGAHKLTYFYYAKHDDLWSVDFVHGSRCTVQYQYSQPVYQY